MRGFRGSLSFARRASVIALLATACAPAAARADLTWSVPPCGQQAGQCQTLSAANTSASQLQVATDAAGDAIAVWLQLDPSAGHIRVVAEYRDAGGYFHFPGYISSTAVDADQPCVAMNAHGDAIACWHQHGDGSNFDNVDHVLYSVRLAGGSFSAPSYASPTIDAATHPSVAIDAAGDAVIAFMVNSGSSTAYVAAVRRPAGTNTPFGGPQQLSGSTDQYPSYYSPPAIAMDAAGDAVVAWLQHLNVSTNEYDAAQASYLPSGGAFGAAQTVSTSGKQAGLPAAAIDSKGNAVIAYVEGDTLAALGPLKVSQTSSGVFGTPQTISDPAGYADQPQLAIDPTGRITAVWAEVPSANIATPSRIYSSTGSIGAGFSAPVALSDAALNSAYPKVGVDAQGRAAVLWIAQNTPNRQSTQYDLVQATSRAAGTAPWATPSTLSPSGTMDVSDGIPQLSVSAAGQAVAVWSFVEGTDLLAHASFGYLPGTGPGGGPPPPPPPIPVAINLAAPYKPGHPIVLTVTVDGDATRLQWHVGGHDIDNPVLAGVVDGHLQRSVRLRVHARKFTVSVDASGPGGSKSYSREFRFASAPRNRFADKPDVFAVGDAAALLGTEHAAPDGAHRNGDLGCGPITIFSAAQKIAGCMRPADALSSIPDRERGVINPIADQLGVNPNNLPVIQDAVSQLDGYVSQGTTLINDTWPVVPQGPADVLSFPQADALTSSNASLEVAGQQFGLDRNGFSMHLDPTKADIPLGDLPRPPKFPSIGGFEVVGDWHVDLQKREAIITASLKLPDWITTAGVKVQNSVTFKATPDRLVLQDVKVGPMSVSLGGSLGLSDFALTYNEAQDEWTGQGRACPIPKGCLDLVPPNGEIKIKEGQLEFAGGSVDFPPPGVPLFPLVDLQRLGFGLGLNPTRITGNGLLAVAHLVLLDGRMVMAFPSEATPFFLKPDEVGGDFPSGSYGVPFTRYTVGASAAVSVVIPDVITLQLGHGYFLYQYPSYVALGGGIDQKILDFLRFYGSIGGEANFSDGTINLHGDIHGCLEVGTEICGGIVANASHGPGNIGGIGGCIDLGDVHVGGGIQWNRKFDPFIWPLDGCKWSRFAVDVHTAKDSATGVTIRVRRGHPSPALKIYGQGAAPLVRVTGPGGQVLDSTGRGVDASPGGRIRIISYHGPATSFTVIGLQNDTPGTYVVTPLPGSVPFAQIARASDPPNARITGRVKGTGIHRILVYRIRRRPGQSVELYDVAEGGSAHGIGKVRGGGHGELRFTPAPGRRRHVIVAQFSLQGLPTERITLTSFRPPSPVLRAPARLRVRRHGKSLTISWRPVREASRYEIAVTDAGYQRVVFTRSTQVTIKHVPRWVGGVVSVRAADAFPRHSRISSAHLRRAEPRPRAITSLGHCTVHRHRISCSGYRRRRHR